MKFFEEETIEQQEVVDWVKSRWGKELMVPIHGFKRDNGKMMRVISLMIPESNDAKAFEFDYVNSSLSPGFYEDGENVFYTRFGNSMGIEPLVINRSYYGLKKAQIEILEDFRLLFNLYYDVTADRYVCLKDNCVVVETDEHGFVYFNRKFLRRYLAARSFVLVMDLATSVDGGVGWDENRELKEFNESTAEYQIRYGVSTIADKKIPFSYITAKKTFKGLQYKGMWS